MKNRNVILITLLLVAAIALGACSKKVEPTPTATPEPTATTVPTTVPTVAVPATEVSAEQPELPVGGVDVAWENVIQPEVDVVAIVSGVSITKEAYLKELKRQLNTVTNNYGLNWYDEEIVSYLPSFQDEIVQQMINQELTKQFAAEEGIVIDDAALEAEIASLEADILQSGQFSTWEEFLVSYGSTQEEIEVDIVNYLLYQRLIAAHGGPSEAEQVHAAHILVETEETGQEVLDKLEAGGVFADLAAEYSIDPGSGPNGGDLGWFPKGMMVPEFEVVAFALDIDEISGLVQSQFGYHIIQLLGKETRPLDPALLEQVQQENFQAWFMGKASVVEVETLVKFAESTP